MTAKRHQRLCPVDDLADQAAEAGKDDILISTVARR
jgi:hypothetical protein